MWRKPSVFNGFRKFIRYDFYEFFLLVSQPIFSVTILPVIVSLEPQKTSAHF